MTLGEVGVELRSAASEISQIWSRQGRETVMMTPEIHLTLASLMLTFRGCFCSVLFYLDEALSQNCGVLVHCLAGVSRSVTVTVAYLMQKLHLSLNDAYDLVKRKKSNISPNFNFMGQLLDFERSLRLGGKRSGGRGSGGPESTVSDPPSFFTTPTSDGVFELDPT